MSAGRRSGYGHARALIVTTMVAVGLLVASAAPAFAAAVDNTTPASEASPPTVPDSTTPEPTTPESTVPESTTESSVASAPVTAEPESDDGTAVAITVFGVLAALGLLGLAAWWMLRPKEPAPSPTDPDWPDRSEVI